MSNAYFDWPAKPAASRFVRFATVRSSDVNAAFDEVSAGFEKLPTAAQIWGDRQNYAADTGSANAYAVTIASTHLTAYDTGMKLRFKATNANTGASTLNLNALGAKAIKRVDGTDLASGDILANQMVDVIYQGTHFQIDTSSAADRIAAAASAAASASSATASASSATASSNSATASAASATAAADSYDAFDDRYLGSKAANPTLDNDGNALLVGAIYWNTASNELRIYRGASVWDSIASTPADGSITTAKLATGISPIVAAINGGQLAGLRNKIINGKMEIAQRGTSFAAIASGAYSLDRWLWGNASTGVVTASQQADVPASNEFQSSLRVAVTTADSSVGAADEAYLQQAVEGYNIRDLIGRTFTLGFWARSSKTGIHTVCFFNSGADRRYIAEYTVSAADTWEFKTIPVTGGLITAGTWNYTNGSGLAIRWNLMTGTNGHGTAGSWVTTGTATANQVNVLDTVGNIFAITGVQLEVGTQATPFEHRPVGLELNLCQRYYETVSGSAFVMWKLRESDGVRRAMVFFRTSKRAAPSVALLGATADGGTSAPAVGVVSTEHVRVDADAGGVTTAAPSFTGFTASAEL